jgi:ABC-type transporter Mla MlaB component
MSKEQGGILGRMMRFVRNPATNWAELDQPESDRDGFQAKANLKEMIERKRRNDFVRKREFDMLRKIRQREALGGAADANARPSFFQSSLPSKPDDRAQTLKKIDEIEAQMSMQWWKTNVPNSSLPPGSLTSVVSSGGRPGPMPMPQSAKSTFRSTQPVALDGTPIGQPPDKPKLTTEQSSEALRQAIANFSTSPVPAKSATPVQQPSVAAGGSAATAGPVAAKSARPLPTARAGGVQDSIPNSTTFSASKFFAVDVEEGVHDADHEEAAIRFANGDDDAAEGALLDALSPAGAHVETWLTLFDFYRATGKHTPFETKGIEYANRFGRSPPVWFSMPEQVALLATPSAERGGESSMHWTAPSAVGAQTVAALKASLSRVQPPWRIDWSKLKSIDAAAFEPLAALFSTWASQAIRLEIAGLAQIDAALMKATPSNQREVPVSAWKARLELQRVTHRADDFEVTALDFCVTYEVSPPSWEPVKCSFKSLDADSEFGGSTIIGEAFRDSVPSSAPGGFGDTSAGPVSSQFHQVTSVELSGQILGDATLALERLESKLHGADLMSISCAKLIRVDFSAAGTLLNWVTARQVEGRMVQFTDVHRMVAAFFHVIGIGEHARVMVRRD